MLSWFWSECFWLPSNFTWDDIRNGPDKTVVYAEASDYWIQVPLVLFVLTLRVLSERHIFAPLGRYLDISDFRRKVPLNPKLETAYLKSSTCKNVTSLAKQLDLSEREVERWWRLRRNQEKPTTLVKFCECMWRGFHYTVNVSLGLNVVWGNEWLKDVDLCFDGYPHQGITAELRWFYMISSSFYISLIVTQFRDVRRKDFWQMFIHHIATISLLYSSWVCQCFRIGSLILILHDMGDIFLEAGKAAKYAKFQRTVTGIFGVFVCVWVVTRLVFFPVYILPTTFSKLTWSPMIFVMNILLVLLFVLSMLWTWLIYNMVMTTISAGQFSKDDRSSNSEDSDSSRSNSANEEFSSLQLGKVNVSKVNVSEVNVSDVH